VVLFSRYNNSPFATFTTFPPTITSILSETFFAFKYKIEGVKAGSTQILFTYQRSWEKDVASIQTDTLTVNVE
jgi:hypothetical protein